MSLDSPVLAVLLAIDDGSGLGPLAANRARAAVPFGGIYRVIDFPLTNCLHSGIRRILVLTQYNSHSLQKHLRDGWSIFNPEIGEYVTPVPPQMSAGRHGYRSALDALRQCSYLIERNPSEAVLVLGASGIYRMDYAALLAAHQASGAAVTVATRTVTSLAGLEGECLLELDDDGAVRGAVPVLPDSAPLTGEAQATMGVMLYSRSALLELLAQESASEECGGLAGLLASSGQLQGGLRSYRFGGAAGRVTPDRYWRQLASLDEYYEAHMDLLRHTAPLDLYQKDWQIRTYQTQNPPARTVPGRSSNEGVFVNSIVAGGSVIAGGGVNHSILFSQVLVDDSATVEDSILLPGAVVGSGARINRCIIDKDTRIPPGESIGFDAAADRARFQVTPSGVVVVPRGFDFSAPLAATAGNTAGNHG
jgi:glucose-1-phosphate adenylyltransferase